jgi:hypothetical protein
MIEGCLMCLSGWYYRPHILSFVRGSLRELPLSGSMTARVHWRSWYYHRQTELPVRYSATSPAQVCHLAGGSSKVSNG